MRSAFLLLCLMLAAQPARAEPATPDTSLSGTAADSDRTLQGFIGPRALELLVKWLHANPHRDLALHLDSKGGRAADGMRLYQAIGAHGRVVTDVQAGKLCLSACGFIWLAGTTRTVADGAMLGFHSAYCTGTCDPRGMGLINQSLLDILARTEPGLAMLVTNTGAMINGNHLIALAGRQNGHWTMHTYQPPS